VVGGGDGVVKVFNPQLQCMKQTRLDGAVVAMSLSPDSVELLAGTSSSTLYRCVRARVLLQLLGARGVAAFVPVRNLLIVRAQDQPRHDGFYDSE
jgi:hypothetical protein